MALTGTLPEELFGFQRDSERFPCSLEGTLVMGGIPYEVECADISARGLGIISPLRLALHSSVKIALTLHDKEVALEGRVSWCSRDICGWKAGIQLNKPIPYELGKCGQ